MAFAAADSLPTETTWISCRKGFFLPGRVISRLFRRLVVESWKKAFDAGQLLFVAALEELRDPTAFRRHLEESAAGNGG